MRLISLATVLFAFWLLLSGHYTTLLIAIGLIAVIGTVLLARRMGVADEEGHPIHLLVGALSYWPWLALEIIKSTIAVSRLVLAPGLAVSPRLVKVRAGQKTPVGINIYANSITLTPGTITVDVKGDVLTVHALTRESAADLASGAMDARVRRLEGGEWKVARGAEGGEGSAGEGEVGAGRGEEGRQ